MARRGSRKVSPALLLDSFALLEAIRMNAQVLQSWHPSLTTVAIIVQMTATLKTELEALKPTESEG